MIVMIHAILDTIIGCPLILRSDYGTENCSLAAVHIAFRYYHDDSLAGQKSFMYGPSKANVVSHAIKFNINDIDNMH